MSNESEKSSTAPAPAQFTPETQKQRWIKYGANVALAIVVVILLAGLITYGAQRVDRRVDTTATGLYSLKPQTVNIIKDNKQKITLVSLYQAKTRKGEDNPYAGPVRDLLEEYARKGTNIEFKAIDPVTQPTLTDNLVSEAVSKYGGAVQAYKEFVDEFYKTTFPKLKEMMTAEGKQLADVATDAFGEDQRSQNYASIVDTISDVLPKSLDRLKETTDRALKPKFPDYKAIVDRIKDQLDNVSEVEGVLIKNAADFKADAKAPEALKKYFTDAPPRLEQIKKLADETKKKIETLGELKVGELQTAIKGQDIILVLGEKEWRVVNSDQVWVADTRDLRNYTEGQQIKPRFAGEQAVTTAILAVSSGTKTKIAFIRAGGPPLTSPGFPPFQRGGPFSNIAEHLRQYNFDVLEKDVTGMWAMQQQMQQQGMPPEPEPSDEQIKDAVWIVIDLPADQRQGPSPTIAPKLLEHLKNGGSALVLAMPGADNFSESLKDYGIELVSDAVAVHEVPKGEHARSSDLAEDAQRLPIIFLTNNYGDHLLARPAQSLDMLLLYAAPVKTTSAAGAKATPILPIPQNIPTWGEHDLEGAQNPSAENPPKFDSGTDVAPPLWAGAVSEKGNSRVVVLGALQSMINQILNVPDQDMLKRGVVVARFPGNEELFTNAVFWLAKMEPMIAISPSAMEVSRIAPMSDATLNTWRIGVLLLLLPGLVLAAGIMMYFSRRD